jgi:hypothetical protein
MAPTPLLDNETRELLERACIPLGKGAEIGPGGAVSLPEERVDPEELRTLGFRLANWGGRIRYLVYRRGRFCGVVRSS